ncbi:MAG: Gfo/Idh/MocA family oxidoreductase [Acidobacteria bacterium]|nr:Gfo/Idh/MocA family oxidoreductase [Acidobacteriota bacterium]MBI3656637.1 Gfo/Idh/MocA family oxidoreductase [Acidobacteriota bacterium]
MSEKQTLSKNIPTRRDFLKTSAAAAIGSTLASPVRTVPGAYAAGSDMIKVGLIGCGGRGTGATQNVFNAAQGVKLVAMADVFKDRLDDSRSRLRKKYADKMEVPDDRCFVGLDAYEKVLALSEVNYVILATPPGFRPQHLQAAVTAGKHIFTEKPVAVDGPGFRACLKVYEEAKAQGLGIGAGTQNRHKTGYLETIRRVHDGAIGTILAGRCYYNTGALWMKPRQPEWSDLEWQLRNWLYFTWLAGDHIVEQHVHNLDAVHWALRSHPLRATGMGGRQVRTDPAYGHIYDHFTVDYEYENDVHVTSMCRQMAACDRFIGEAFIGSKGTCRIDNYTQYSIKGETNWRFAGPDNDPYVQEHANLIASIRAGKPINGLKNVAESSLIGIMGRMSAYSGKVVTWEQAANSKETLMPPKLAWGPLPVPPVAMPGQTELF